MIRRLAQLIQHNSNVLPDLFDWQFPWGHVDSITVISLLEGCSANPALFFATLHIVDIIVDNIRAGDVEFPGQQESSLGVIVMHQEGGLPSPIRSAFWPPLSKFTCRRVIYA